MIISLCRVTTVFKLGKKQIHSTSTLNTFWVRDEKGGYKGHEEMPPLSRRIPEGFGEFKKEIALFRKEIQDAFNSSSTPLFIRHREIDTIWKFGDEYSLNNWVVSADSDHNEGCSSCTLSLTKDRTGLFSGNLSKVLPKDGRVSRAGYCNMKTKTFRKSFKREIYFDWTRYNTLNLRVKGDGRSYFINIGTKGYFDLSWNDMYHYIIFTRGGPYWQNIKIPFSKFFFSSRGRIQDKQHPIALDKISSFGITVADKVDGPFSLEIAYIGAEYDTNHQEIFAYEMYQLEDNIAST